MQYLIVFITAPSRKEADEISQVLLDKRIIACANIIENVDSYFWWKSKKQKARECLLIVKTTRPSLKKLIKAVRRMHSYDVPEIIAVPTAGGYKPYLEWLKTAIAQV